jgi:hypothetical protein
MLVAKPIRKERPKKRKRRRKQSLLRMEKENEETEKVKMREEEAYCREYFRELDEYEEQQILKEQLEAGFDPILVWLF